MNKNDPNKNYAMYESDREAKRLAQTVDYSQQCRQWASNSKERCAMCQNHPGEHSFPVTSQRDELLEHLKTIISAVWNGDIEANGAEFYTDPANIVIAKVESNA